MITLLVSDDDYEERMKSRQPQNQLDDIRDWQSGNKSMAEEAIDKVKEFVSKVKFFDTPDDYPYVSLRLFYKACFSFDSQLVICGIGVHSSVPN